MAYGSARRKLPGSGGFAVRHQANWDHREARPSGSLGERIRHALANPLTTDEAIDPLRELAGVLEEVSLTPHSGGGEVTFTGRDPIVKSPLAFATMAAVALMAKSVSVAAFWHFRGGEGQNLAVNLGQALHRLCPFYDKKWELLNGFPPGNPADPANPFMPTNMYRTRDGRRILFMNIYPKLRTAALAFLGCNDDPRAIGSVIRQWNAFELETRANRAGLQATVIRRPEEFLETQQGLYLEDLPLIDIEKIADGSPEPLMSAPAAPLSGIRALGFSHVIAGPGLGRALAYHGADVLNLWSPNAFEMDFNYYSANVGMRSALLDFSRNDDIKCLQRLVSDADVFFANRRPGQLERLGITTEELTRLRPGIVQVDFSIYGAQGPWADRIGFDHTAGGVSGVLALEGSVEEPKLPEIFVVNDFIASWIGMVGAIAALRRRATEGGSYRVRVSLARISLWLLQMGVFDKRYVRQVAGGTGEHAYPDPELFEAETPCGHYQGVTDQVVMTGTPGSFAIPLVPRGANRPQWLAR
jgi:crotonobetainyl-CoA:carnitine CoA-transferase CaiB-like acyl-CoA transferase